MQRWVNLIAIVTDFNFYYYHFYHRGDLFLDQSKNITIVNKYQELFVAVFLTDGSTPLNFQQLNYNDTVTFETKQGVNVKRYLLSLLVCHSM